MGSGEKAPQIARMGRGHRMPEYMVSGCYGHSCGELFRALLAVAVAWEERLAEKSFYFGGAIHLPHGFADYQ